MSDGNVSLVPDVIKSASDAIQANTPETAKQADGALSTVVGFFNNVVLYPVKKANLSFKYKLDAFEKDLQEKIKDIPDENLQIPPAMIAGPALEALRYTYDEEQLREMYENLLASAMDTRKVQETHPAFVDAIRQMSSLDVQVLSKILRERQLACVQIRFSFDETKIYLGAMPKYFSPKLCDLGDPFMVSSSLTNLERLGLIEIEDITLLGFDYDSIKKHPYVLQRLEAYKDTGKEIELQSTNYAIEINDYGRKFGKICLAKEIYHAD